MNSSSPDAHEGACGLASVALVFPGQGSQFVGMGLDLAREFPAAREVLERADELLGYSLTAIMAGKHGEELNRTVHTQPAIFVHSMALWEVLQAGPVFAPVLGGGHSLGEYSALCAAGVLSFEDALKLVSARARAMDEAQPQGSCGMVAVIGIDRDTLLSVVDDCRGSEILEAANFNAPDQIVVSGHVPALERLVDAVKNHKRSKAVRLSVSSAFHTSLMEPAREILRTQLDEIRIKAPSFPVISNVTAEVHSTADRELKQLLIDQVVNPVRWEDCVRTMLQEGAQTFVEVGPGKVLTGLLRRIDRNARAINISDPEGVRSLERVCE